MTVTILMPTPDPDPYKTEILSQSPTYYWTLGETSGPAANEEIVGLAMAGIHSNVTFGQSSINNGQDAILYDVAAPGGARTDSISGAAPFTEFNFIHQTAVFTISCWVQLDTLTGERTIMANTAATAETGFWFYYVDGFSGRTNALRMGIVRGVGGQFVIDGYFDNLITDMNPHHVAVKCNGTNMDFFVDGVKSTAVNTVGTLGAGNAPRNPNIGRWNYTVPGGYFDGIIEDLAIWNSAISDSSIVDQYNAGS